MNLDESETRSPTSDSCKTGNRNESFSSSKPKSKKRYLQKVNRAVEGENLQTNEGYIPSHEVFTRIHHSPKHNLEYTQKY